MEKKPAKAFRLVDEITPAPSAARAWAVSPVAEASCDSTDAYAAPVMPTGKAAPEKKKKTAPAETKGEVQVAMEKAVALLEYGDVSRRRLIRKLTDRGFPEEIAEMAVDALVDRGYLKEGDACARRAEQDVRKGWGKRRIAEDLYACRYPRTVIDEVLASLEDSVDFTDNCARVIRKKYRGVPRDRDDRRRMTAALIRMGYGMEEIRAAMIEVAEEAEDA